MKDNKTIRIIYVFTALAIFIASLILIKTFNDPKSKKIKKEAIVIDSSKYDDANEGKLVIITGKLTTLDNIKDTEFLVELTNATKLERKVQILRYYNDEKLKKVSTRWENVLDSYESEVTDSKEKIYSNIESTIIDSSYLIDGRINNFNVLAQNFEKVQTNSILKTLPTDKLEEISTLNNNTKFYIHGNYITTYESTPKAGDIRISFNYYDISNLGEYTAIGKQFQNQLVPYEMSKDESFIGLYEGKLSAKQIARKINPKGTIIKTCAIIVDILTLLAGLIIFGKGEKTKTNL